jgi:hypothetical protein
MGDRANVLVRDNYYTNGVYLYTHWGGYNLPKVLQNALKKEWRWDDASYLARIIFDEMTDGEHGKETGYGISSRVGDGGDRILIVDTGMQRIFFADKEWSFTQYCHLSGDDLDNVWNMGNID